VDDEAAARARATAGDGDLDPIGVRRGEPPQRGRAAMAEHRAGARREQRRPQSSTLRQRRVADAVDAAVHEQQPPAPGAMVDRGAAEAERAQLVPRHDPVAARRERGDPPVDAVRRCRAGGRAALTAVSAVNAVRRGGRLPRAALTGGGGVAAGRVAAAVGYARWGAAVARRRGIS
jgi:hypothetical protein